MTLPDGTKGEAYKAYQAAVPEGTCPFCSRVLRLVGPNDDDKKAWVLADADRLPRHTKPGESKRCKGTMKAPMEVWPEVQALSIVGGVLPKVWLIVGADTFVQMTRDVEDFHAIVAVRERDKRLGHSALIQAAIKFERRSGVKVPWLDGYAGWLETRRPKERRDKTIEAWISHRATSGVLVSNVQRVERKCLGCGHVFTRPERPMFGGYSQPVGEVFERYSCPRCNGMVRGGA